MYINRGRRNFLRNYSAKTALYTSFVSTQANITTRFIMFMRYVFSTRSGRAWKGAKLSKAVLRLVSSSLLISPPQFFTRRPMHMDAVTIRAIRDTREHGTRRHLQRNFLFPWWPPLRGTRPPPPDSDRSLSPKNT